jgi:hypothetical protein
MEPSIAVEQSNHLRAQTLVGERLSLKKLEFRGPISAAFRKVLARLRCLPLRKIKISGQHFTADRLKNDRGIRMRG